MGLLEWGQCRPPPEFGRALLVRFSAVAATEQPWGYWRLPPTKTPPVLRRLQWRERGQGYDACQFRSVPGQLTVTPRPVHGGVEHG